ncbi:hypothetical protein [Deinococcus geothermalis]|nr:hypothetical protein [Deinococcus geothermalis]
MWVLFWAYLALAAFALLVLWACCRVGAAGDRQMGIDEEVR